MFKEEKEGWRGDGGGRGQRSTCKQTNERLSRTMEVEVNGFSSVTDWVPTITCCHVGSTNETLVLTDEVVAGQLYLFHIFISM